MPERLVKLTPIGVIGPFPSSGCFIMVQGHDNSRGFTKVAALECDISDAYAMDSTLKYQTTPYTNVIGLMGACGISILSCKVNHEKDMLYSTVLLSSVGGKKPMKVSAATPGLAINLALSGKAFLHMSQAVFDTLPNCSPLYATMRDRIGSVFPMPRLTSTEDLRVACEFVDLVKADK